jgi:LPS-assembly protein
MTISADTIEHFREDDRFVAKGNVRIEKDAATVYADEVTFYRATSRAVIAGNTIYDDDDVVIQSDGADFNLDAKTGTLKKAVIFFRKDNYWITGAGIEKLDDMHYYVPEAAMTTCDVPPYLVPEKFALGELKAVQDLQAEMDIVSSEKLFARSTPDWCFKGKKVDVLVGRRLTATNATYRVKGLPLFYTPYLWAPIGTERETGFLVPAIGNSSSKGFEFSPVFYWAIDDDKDATFYVDYYSKRGTGVGVEYRQMTKPGLNSWFAYYIHDRDFGKDFLDVKGTQYLRLGDAKGYLDVNYMNDSDFYREYGFNPGAGPSIKYTGIKRFLQSSGEMYVSPGNSRLYLLGQYWVDLTLEDQGTVLQKLPEVGYALHPTKLGPLTFTVASSLGNYYRDEGIRGQRLDIVPTLSHTMGDAVQLFQSVSLRETAFFLNEDEPFGSSPHRESFQYLANAQMRFTKKYGSFVHILEPSLQYRFIPNTNTLPLFEAGDLFDRVSTLQFALSNVVFGDGLSLWFRLIQGYDFNADGPLEPFLPTRFQAAILSPFFLRLDMSYDFNTNRTETFNAETGIRLFDRLGLYVSERYSRPNNIQYYTASADAVITPRLSVGASVSYDGAGAGLREYVVRTTYNDQCWGVTAAFTRRPASSGSSSDYNFMMLIELKGVGKYRIL